MADKLDNSAPFNDDQGTRTAKEPIGAGAEATEGVREEPLDSHSHEHVSGYGGNAGTPKQSSDRERRPHDTEKPGR